MNSEWFAVLLCMCVVVFAAGVVVGVVAVVVVALLSYSGRRRYCDDASPSYLVGSSWGQARCGRAPGGTDGSHGIWLASKKAEQK